MSDYDQAHGINRLPSGAPESHGGRFDFRDHPEADSSVKLSSPASPPSTVPVTVGISWMEYGVIPKGKRKPRTVVHRENVEVPVRAVTDEEAPTAVGKARFFEGRFYQPGGHWDSTYDDERLGVSYREMGPFFRAPTTDPDAVRQAEINTAASELSRFLFVDGICYEKCGEPHYVAERRSGGGYVDASYDKLEYASEDFFRADQLSEALEHAGLDRLPDGVDRLEVHDSSVLGADVKPVLDLGYEDRPLWTLSGAERTEYAQLVLTSTCATAPRTARGSRIDFTALTGQQRDDYERAVKTLLEDGVALTVASA